MLNTIKKVGLVLLMAFVLAVTLAAPAGSAHADPEPNPPIPCGPGC